VSLPAWAQGAGVAIDALGFRCPVPVVKLEAALRRATPGDRIAIRSDDPIAALDLPHAAQTGGHRCERLPAEGEVCVFLITKEGP
jgi:tRNA 2-thiouridine synthesizing protein A